MKTRKENRIKKTISEANRSDLPKSYLNKIAREMFSIESDKQKIEFIKRKAPKLLSRIGKTSTLQRIYSSVLRKEKMKKERKISSTFL